MEMQEQVDRSRASKLRGAEGLASGYSVFATVGRWGGFHFGWDGPAFRVVIGWVAMVALPYDIDRFVGVLYQHALNETREKERVLQRRSVSKSNECNEAD